MLYQWMLRTVSKRLCTGHRLERLTTVDVVEDSSEACLEETRNATALSEDTPNSASPSEAFLSTDDKGALLKAQILQEGRYDSVLLGKGIFISGGASGIVELLPSGHVIKSPWEGINEEDSRRDIENEARIYRHLGCHPRLVSLLSYVADEGIVLEYMANGSLKDYLGKHSVSVEQRKKWALEAAEGLALLHSRGVIHCDTKPRNFLVDNDLGLRIIDFGGSSLHGSKSSACESTRFYLPRDWRQPSTTSSDLFALGSTIYEIMTGMAPYADLPSKDVEKLYEAQNFPDVTSVPCGHVIRRCWRGEVESAEEAREILKASLHTEGG